MIQFTLDGDLTSSPDHVKLTLERDVFGNPCVAAQRDGVSKGYLFRFLGDGSVGLFHHVNHNHGFRLGNDDDLLVRSGLTGAFMNAVPGTPEETNEEHYRVLTRTPADEEPEHPPVALMRMLAEPGDVEAAEVSA